MTIYLSHCSALDYWRRNPLPEKRYRGALPFGTISAKIQPARREIDALARTYPWLSPPYHMSMPNTESRSYDPRVRSHVCSTSLQVGSYICAGNSLYVASPELCFVQLARILEFPELLQRGFELCGGYRLPNGIQGAAIEAQPLMTVRSLNRYLEKAGDLSGSKAARRSARYLCDGSRSPMESDIAILLHLPIRCGGFGLPKPTMNKVMAVPANLRAILPQKTFAIDLYWPDASLGLEYDSRQYHEGSRAVNDLIRSNGIEQMGIRVLTMSTPQALDPREFTRIARIIGRQVGKREHPLSYDCSVKRAKLRTEIFKRFADTAHVQSQQSMVPMQ